MCASFSDDDVGKTVVNANGDEVGMVTAVEHDTIRVKPDAGITDSIKAALGWEDTGEDTYPLQEASIDRVTADEVRLSGDLRDRGSSAAGAGTSAAIDDSTTGVGAGTDRGAGSGTLDRESDDLGGSVSDEPRAEEGLSGDSDDVRSSGSRNAGTEIGSGSGTGQRDGARPDDRDAAIDGDSEISDRERRSGVSGTTSDSEEMVGGGEPPHGERTERTGRTPDDGLEDVGEERFEPGEQRDRPGASERRGGAAPGEPDPIDSDADADSDRAERRRATDSDRGDTDSDSDGLASDDDDDWPDTDSDSDR